MDVDTLDQDYLRREGGEEMEGMTLMVPRFSRKGKLYAGEFASRFTPCSHTFPRCPFLSSVPPCPFTLKPIPLVTLVQRTEPGSPLTYSPKTIHPTPHPRTRPINNSRTIRQRHDININIKYPLIPLNRQNTSDHYSDTRKKGSTHPPPKIQE